MITMKHLRILLAAMVLALPYSQPALADDQPAAAAAQPGECREAVALLREYDAKISRDLRGIKRDIAALNQAVDEPGLREAFAGIGYILGLFGVAALVASRRQQGRSDR